MLLIRSLVFIFTILITACSAPVKQYHDQIIVSSINHKFIDELFDSGKEPNLDIPVWVSYPDKEKFPPPYPAIMLLHSSWGLSSQESFYAKEFNDIGLAVYAIDSFTPRRVSRTSLDQSLVSSAAMIQDAYQVLDYLQTDPIINRDKVAVMGFSKGGIVAFYSAFNSVNQAANQRKQSFAAHIAYYPWCGMRLHDMSTTGAPILIQGGDKDVVTPVKICEQLIDEEITATDKKTITVKHHPTARHAFDHPTLAKVPIVLSLNAQVPALCDIRQTADGNFVEMYSNKKVSGNNIKSVLEVCSTFNGSAGSNRQATNDALEITKQFIAEHLL